MVASEPASREASRGFDGIRVFTDQADVEHGRRVAKNAGKAKIVFRSTAGPGLIRCALAQGRGRPRRGRPADGSASRPYPLGVRLGRTCRDLICQRGRARLFEGRRGRRGSRGETAWDHHGILARPMPCSPVMTPPHARNLGEEFVERGANLAGHRGLLRNRRP